MTDDLAAPTVSIRGLSHVFGTGRTAKAVLGEIDLALGASEIAVMTGPSGSGKTTLLTLIGALRSVQTGTLEVLGSELSGLDPNELVGVRRRIGFIFQTHNLFDSLTAHQNVRMALDLAGRGTDGDPAREALVRVGLAARLHHKPDALSVGERQRVAIARALVNHPRLILADEPTASLDRDAAHDVMTLLQSRVREGGATIVLVTHDNRILDAADRIVNLVDGRIVSNVAVRESVRICEFLAKCQIFSALPPATLAGFADQMIAERYPAGSLLIRRGDPGDKFYVIHSGQAEVFREADGIRQQVNTLGPGEFFGEMALLSGAPRSASVVAATPIEVYTLGKEAFGEAIETSPSLEDQLRRVFFSRQEWVRGTGRPHLIGHWPAA